MKGKRQHSRLGAIALGLAVSAIAASCGMSSGLLSDSERSSLYTLTINTKDGAPIGNGAVVPAGTQISALVAKSSGASDPAVLDLGLAKASGEAVSSLRFATGAADSAKLKAPTAAVLKKVAGIDGKLEGFAIPVGQAPGAYQLSLSIAGPDGASLQQETIVIFVGDAQPAIDSVSVFPPSVEPGAAVLLGLTVSWSSIGPNAAAATSDKAAHDPWIKWSRDGSVFAEGLQSAGFAKVVWTAPRIEGAYSIRAEVFPSAPVAGGTFSFKAAASQDLRVMVISPSGGSGNDFADPLAFYSLLKLEGNFDDSGTRPRSAPPHALGSPELDTYSSGFGYRLNSDDGVVIPGLMPPSASGGVGPFAVLIRLSPDKADGTLVSFASADGSYALVLGLKDGKPYVDYKAAGGSQRSIASAAAPSGPLTLEAIFRPAGDTLAISWRAEGLRIDASSIPMPQSPPAGSAALGGTGSVPGVYDGFGLLVPGASSAYPSPTYRLAMRRAWKSALVLAEGFEDGVLPSGSSASGDASLSELGLQLASGASLALSPSLNIGSGLAIEAGFEGDGTAVYLDFSNPGGDSVFSVRGTGEVLDAAGAVLGTVSSGASKLSFTVEQRNGKLYLAGSGAASAIQAAISTKALRLALRKTGAQSAIFQRICVRTASSGS